MSPGLLVFALTYLAAVASPGPGIAAVVARVLGRGPAGLPAFVAGFVVGDLVWFGMAAAGLTALAQAFAAVFTVVRYAGAAYLAFMAWRLWNAPVGVPKADRTVAGERGGQLFSAGLALTLGNPKVMVFFLAVLPTVVRLDSLSAVDALAMAATIAVVLPAVFAVYVFLALRARRSLASPRSLRRLNRGTGVVMAGAAISIAAR